MLVLGGSGGEAPEDDPQALVQRGYVVLSLAYVGAPGLPAELGDVPLEYFDKGLAFLKAQPGVDPRRIGIMGTSKGAEAALLIATRNRDIKVVVALAPSSVAWQGIGAASRGAGAGSWSLAGRSVPYLPYDRSAPFTTVFDQYQRSWARRAEHPEAEIPVERIGGPVMLVCGGNDALWPSCPMAQAVAERLKAKGFGHGVSLLRYNNAGHGGMGQPFIPPEPDAIDPWGGTQAANAEARAQSWPRVLAFLKAALKP